MVPKILTSATKIRRMASRMLGRHKLARIALLLLLLVLYCEWLHYFVVLVQCTWPRLQAPHPGSLPQRESSYDLKVMFLADTHLLGLREGHWFDKLRREWQMKRAFQTSMLLHRPDVVFVLGDLLDEGKWCDDAEFQYHVERFHSMFHVPEGTQLHQVVGNHDIGFHYMVTPHKRRRFDEAFGSKSVAMLRVNGVVFVLVNSMALEGDSCEMCREAQRDLAKMSTQLKCAKQWTMSARDFPTEECVNQETFEYSKPVLLQHFPLYRPSDANCSTPDAAPDKEKFVPFQEKHDTLSREATSLMFKLLEPRLVVDAHIHHGCYRLHDNGVPEWTVPSFSWRNKMNPTFLMARLSSMEHKVRLCQMPDERTVIAIYVFGVVAILISLCLQLRQNKLGKYS